MPGSTLSDLINILSFIQGQEAREQQRIGRTQAVRREAAARGVERLTPEQIQRLGDFVEPGLAGKELTSEPEFIAFQQQGVGQLLGLQDEFQRFMNTYQQLAPLVKDEQAKRALDAMRDLTRKQVLDRAKILMRFFRLQPGAAPSPLAAGVQGPEVPPEVLARHRFGRDVEDILTSLSRTR